MICIFSAMATAGATSGTVHGGTLKMRMEANTTSYVACYLKNKSTVTIYDDSGPTFYQIGGKGYQHSNLTGWYKWKTGYGMKSFIRV